MEKLKNSLDETNKCIKAAGHMLYVTYPLIKDNRLFIGIIENLNKSLKLCMDSILYYERLYKKISPYPNDFHSKLDILNKLVRVRYKFDRDISNFILNIDNLVKTRKAAPVEFVRKEGFVICNHEYKTKVLTLEELKNYYLKAKTFILQVNNIVERNTKR